MEIARQLQKVVNGISSVVTRYGTIITQTSGLIARQFLNQRVSQPWLFFVVHLKPERKFSSTTYTTDVKNCTIASGSSQWGCTC